jgi:DNA-binding MarR family transcriptional regulator
MASSQNTVVPEVSALFAEGQRSFASRWKHSELFAQGFVAVPTLFLRHYAHLKPHRLTFGETMFVLHLMEFKWDADAPFPGYGTIAKRMGISDKMARRHAQSLEAKKYLRREIRTGRTNRFDLSPLFDALLKAAQAEQKKIRATRKPKLYVDANVWVNLMMDAFIKLSKEDRAALESWVSANAGTATRSEWPGWEKLIGKRPKE